MENKTKLFIAGTAAAVAVMGGVYYMLSARGDKSDEPEPATRNSQGNSVADSKNQPQN